MMSWCRKMRHGFAGGTPSLTVLEGLSVNEIPLALFIGKLTYHTRFGSSGKRHDIFFSSA